MKPEDLVAKRISNYLLTKHDKVPFRFDLVDRLGNSYVGKQIKQLHGKWSRGYVDLFIATGRGGFGGLMLELKKDGVLANTEHTRRQADYHAVLRFNSYKVSFCCGFDDCKKKIKNYLKLKKNKI